MVDTTFHGWSFAPEFANDWALRERVFTDSECDQIIEYGESLRMDAAGIGGRGSQVLEVRDSRVSWMHCKDPAVAWVYKRMQQAIMELNDQAFKFYLWGFLEAFQFTRYDAPGGKYDVHVDRFNGGMVIRKLSASVLLTDPNTYEGGDLDVWVGGRPSPMPRVRGAMIAFPSFLLHAVQPITKGTRHSLVSWVAGKPFK